MHIILIPTLAILLFSCERGHDTYHYDYTCDCPEEIIEEFGKEPNNWDCEDYQAWLSGDIKIDTLSDGRKIIMIKRGDGNN